MFAVIKTGGKQYRVAADDVLKIEKIKGEPGEIIQLGDVLVVGGDSVTLGAPTIAGASVAAEVLDQGRGPKVIAFKKRRRKNSRRKRGHRQEFTLLADHRDPDRRGEADQDGAAQGRAQAEAGRDRCRRCGDGRCRRGARQGGPEGQGQAGQEAGRQEARRER